MKRKLSVLVVLILALSIVFALPVSADAVPENGFYEEYGDWYFYRDGVMVTDEIIEYNGYLYAFNDWGRMYEDQRFDLYSEEEEERRYYCAGPGGALYVESWYWDKWNECWYYYGENGIAPYYEFLTVEGTQYYFEYAGRMFTDGARQVWDPEEGTYFWYAFNEYGGYAPLDVSKVGWVECQGNWYYVKTVYEYGDADLACNELFNIDGNNYLFGNYYAMVTNEFVCDGRYDEETEQWIYDYYYANAYGMPYVGWLQPYANETDPDFEYRKDWWFYFGDDGRAYEGYQTVNGTEYYFDYDGQMRTDSYGIEESTPTYAWVTDENGIASRTERGWLKWDDDFRYFDGTDWADGLQEIDGSYYYFRYERMLADGEYDGYRAKADGRLYRNEWYQNDNDVWYYYGADCRKVTGTVADINGVYYAFGDWGEMLTDCIWEEDPGNTYILDKNGVGTLVTGTGWYAVEDRWAYAEDGELVYDGWKTIDGSEYYFDGYYIRTNTCLWGEYLLAPGGQKIKDIGWHVVNGEYYYITDASGALANGWYAVNGQYYYFFPSMAHNTVVEDYDNGCVYGFDTNGGYFQVTGDGFYSSWIGTKMYIKDSKLVTESWEYINGNWYYFDEYGYRTVGPAEVGEVLYLFDADGKLVYDSWCTIDGVTFRSDAAGMPLTGYRYVDGKYYLFTDYGSLHSGGIFNYDGYTYLLHNDGSVYAYEFTPYTWYNVDGEWYYYADGYFLRGEAATIDGYEYAFEYNGCMVTDEWWSGEDADGNHYSGYYDNAGHRLVNTWRYTPYGYKYYNEHGEDYYWGYYTIDGTEYCFEDSYMKAGTFVHEGYLVSTTGGGAVISKTPLSDGWTYSDGKFHYAVDSDRYFTGWVGPYYVQNGVMCYYEVVHDGGNRYFIDANGLYIHSGWYNRGIAEEPFYLYANADGTLARGWQTIDGVQYYFDKSECFMYADGIWEIDGEYHEFAESGAWLGAVEEEEGHNGYANGWVYLDGKYYYSYNGQFLQGSYYIDGAWYCFGGYYGDEMDPYMIADRYYDNFYFTASGAWFEGTGWQIIEGHYVYFDENSRVQTGLIDVYGTKYYITSKYINEDTEDEKRIYYMVSNGYVMYDGVLYYASAGGALSKVANPNGWYWVENRDGYVYYKNGTLLCDGEYVVNGTAYYFYEDGQMMSDDWIGGAYYSASGAKLTGTGWYWSDSYDAWLYVNNGKLYRDGLYYINGVAYYFTWNGFWVS